MSSDTISQLAATIHARRLSTGEASYTKSLLDAGVAKCARKFGEEAVEAVIAAMENDPQALKSEAADVIYHLLVLLEVSGVSLDEVLVDLEGRMKQSGHQEKASRGAALNEKPQG